MLFTEAKELSNTIPILFNAFGDTACKSVFQKALAAQLHSTMRCVISAYGSIILWCVIYHVSLMGRFSLVF